MKIPKHSSRRIVEEISDVIGEQVNMMDELGIIVASTDPARLGTFHGGAKRIIDERLPSLAVAYLDEYPGARPGINLPIEYQGDIVGVIGVTGPAEQVKKYGQIIKKMTEILILDISMQEENDLEDRIRTRFLNDWIHAAPRDLNRRLVESGRQLGIDVTLSRRILLVSILPSRESDSAALQREIDEAEKQLVRRLRKDPDMLTFKSGSELVVAVRSMDDRHLLAMANTIKNDVERSPALVACVGGDSPVAGFSYINTAYIRAEKALRTCMRSPAKAARLYESINMEIFSGDVPDITKLEYIQRVFHNCTPEEIRGWVATLETFYSCEGSIAKTAEKLFIHKNTLQYRLRQLAEKTGYDPRSIRFSSLYYIAIHFYADVGERL